MTIYYSPEAFNSRIIGDVDLGSGYEYNMVAVFQRNADDALFWGDDSGCSCNSPFDYVDDISELTPIHSGAEFAKAARKWLQESYGASADDRDGIERLIIKTRQTLKAARG